MITLENEELLVTVSEEGAELQKIYHKKEELDYLWDGNPEYWGRHAPLLFPIIGRLNEDKYKKDGKLYEMTQHGFARDKTFKVGSQSNESVEFVLEQDEDTLVHYPYDFKLTVTYTLKGSLLAVDYKVKNNSNEQMPFSLGAHPAFNVPLKKDESFDDYTVTINPREEAYYFESNPLPFRNGKRSVLGEMKDGVMALNHAIFDEGLIIIDEPKMDTITLEGPEKHGVTLNVAEFPYVCLWTKEEANAPFLCIEPFFGLPDIAGEIGELEHKGGVILLEEEQERNLGFTIDLF
ncbi:MAG: aldose 1-epimerase family protein [Pisciglobus halotolerans]|nr:aldose 1-epimerase family protein [Pisciglobus halotolerans]